MSGDDFVDGEGWRRGYDDWKADAPDTGADHAPRRRICVKCSCEISNVTGDCAGRCTPRERDAIANTRRGWR